MDTELNKNKSFIIRLAFSTFTAYMGCYSVKNLISAIRPEMMESGAFSKTTTGNMSSAFFYAYAIGQLLNGLLGDKISPKKLISAGLMFSGVIAFIFPYIVLNNLTAYILWAICGFLCSMLWAPLSKTVAENVPENKARVLMLSLTAASIVGQMVAYIIAAICSAVSGWKTTFYITGIILFSISILYYIVLTVLEKKGYVRYSLSSRKKNISDSVETSILEQKTPISAKYLLSHAIVPAAICVMANGVVRNAVSDWVPTYIKEAFETSTTTANAISILLPVVNLVGAILSLKLLKLFKDNEHKFSAVLYGITALLFTYMFLLGSFNAALTIAVLFISCALANAVANLYFSVYILRFTNTGKTSSISGSLDCAAYIASAIATSLIGISSKNFGWTVTIGTWIIIAIIGMVSCICASKKLKGKEF